MSVVEETKIFIDMDGVLFDFQAHYEAVTGRELGTISDEEKETLFTAEFFENIPPVAGVLNTIRARLMTDGLMGNETQFRVLSSVGNINTQEVINGKMAALSIHYPHLASTALFALKSKDKAEMVGQEGVVLVDDRMKALTPWVEAGGIGYQYDVNRNFLSRVNI